MKIYNHCTLILFILVLLVGHSYGLKCYVCNSAHDEGCGSNPPPEKYLKECNSNTAKPVFQGVVGDNRNFSIILEREHLEDDEETQTGLHFTNCRKDDALIPDQYNSEGFWKEETRRIFRSCGWLGKPMNRCKLISNEPIHLIECSCTVDNCNTGHQLQISSIYVTSILVLALVILIL